MDINTPDYFIEPRRHFGPCLFPRSVYDRNMTRDESESLQSEWKAAAKGKCLHPVLSLEISQRSYLTGVYFCVRCGSEIQAPLASEASPVEGTPLA